MTNIKVFTLEEVKAIFANSLVSMWSYFKDLKLEISQNYYEHPTHQLALIYAIDRLTKEDAAKFDESYATELSNLRKSIEEKEKELVHLKERLTTHASRHKELKKLPSIKAKFDLLSKQ